VASQYNEPDHMRITAEAVGWLLGERSYQLRKFGTELDDAHTSEGLDENGWWWRQLTNYLHRAHVLGLSSDGGRQALAKFSATACGLGESVLRLYGPLWRDGGPVERLVRYRPGHEADELFRWVLAQRAEGRQGERDADDQSLAQGLTRDGALWRGVLEILTHIAVSAPLSTPDGRLCVGRLVIESVRMVESSLRTFGPLPLPGVPSGGGLRVQTA
jgi:hypothetical protein